ncbi:unnamed protein product [Sphagnum balticum]
MNADTERRLAAMIEEEAAVLRKQADRDGVAAYLAKPVVKARPNRQFLSAMVRSVEQCLLRSPSFLSSSFSGLRQPCLMSLYLPDSKSVKP